MIKFIKCKNCGKFVEVNKAEDTKYCCKQCSAHYTRCVVCGKYFPDNGSSRCSAECITIYKIKNTAGSLDEDLRETT